MTVTGSGEVRDPPTALRAELHLQRRQHHVLGAISGHGFSRGALESRRTRSGHRSLRLIPFLNPRVGNVGQTKVLAIGPDGKPLGPLGSDLMPAGGVIIDRGGYG